MITLQRQILGIIVFTILFNYASLAQNSQAVNVYDITKRVNASLLADTAYWHKQAITQSTEALINQLQAFNTYPDAPAKNWWTVYYYQVKEAFQVPYLVYVPKNYDPAKKTPLHVYLHGGVNKNEFGDPQAVPGIIAKVLKQAMQQNAIIMYPFARKDFNWLFHQPAFDAILGQIKQVKTLYNVDDNKVYIGGHSDGARGAFWFALNHSYPFAACFGICYEPLLLNTNTPLRNLSNTRFYGISAVNDQLFNNQQVNQIFRYGRSQGANWENVNVQGQHNLPFASPDSVYTVFGNVIGRTRNPLPKQINWETSNTRYGRFGWIAITGLDTLQQAKGWHKAYNLTITSPFNGADEKVDLMPHKAGAVTTTIRGNTIIIKTSRVKQITFYALHGLMDYTKPVVFRVNEQPEFSVMIKPDNNVVINEFLNTADRRSILLNKVVITVQ